MAPCTRLDLDWDAVLYARYMQQLVQKRPRKACNDVRMVSFKSSCMTLSEGGVRSRIRL